MTIRSKVQSSTTNKGLWPDDLAAIAASRFLELAGNVEDVTAEQARDLYAQLLWEFVEDGKLTVGDLCFIAGHFAAEGAAMSEMAEEDVNSLAVLMHTLQKNVVDA